MVNTRFVSADAQMKKGILEMCVLHMIHEKSTYGYDVMKTIRQYFPEVNESTVYVILRRLDKEGDATVQLDNSGSGPPRKYYHITDHGAEMLKNSIASWKRVNDALANMGL